MNAVLNKTCEVQRPSVTQGAIGVSRVWSSHLTGVACALQQKSARELGQVSDGVSSLVAEHRLWFPLGTDIVKTDRVIVGGVTYEVVGVNSDVAGVGHHGSADLLEVRP
jgi:head-tail adaptor